MTTTPTGAARRFFHRLADLQVDRPGLVLLVAAALTAIALGLATRLRLHTGFEYLLPQDRASVRELNRVAKKTAGVSTLFVVLYADTGTTDQARAALRRAGDDLTARFVKIGDPWVGSAEDGVQDAYRFLTPRAGLYAKVDDLQRTKDDIEARYEYEVNKAAGTLLDESDKPPDIDAETIKRRFGIGPSSKGSGSSGASSASSADRYPDGYYEARDGRVLVVAVRSKILGTDAGRGGEAIRRVRAAIADAHLEASSPPITYGFGGDLYTGVGEVSAVNRDLTQVGITGVALLAGVVLLFYLRLRALFAILSTVLVGVSWSFGFSQLAVGYLNLATGFLFTIIAGNGINAGIILIARYFEARHKGEDLRASIHVALDDTWVATLTAACAAAAAYWSLTITEFRGFRDFGLIGGVGMLLCWVGTYWTMPAILVVLERFSPLEPARSTRWTRFRDAWGNGFGRPFAWLVPHAPRLVASVGIALALAGVVGLVRYVRSDPMEYDMNNLRNDRRVRADEARHMRLADEITGYVGAESMAILVDQPEQVAMLRDVLDARRDAAPEGQKPFKALHALQDMVPDQQAQKIALLLAIKDKVVRAHKRGLLKEEDWKQIEKYLPPDDVKPFGMADLPADAARTYTETDGTRGRIVFISPTDGEHVEDTHYLLRWADAYREATLPDGSVIVGSGRAVIYADMWQAVIDAVPPAVCFSFLATLAVVLVAFRGKPQAFIVVGALLVGISWLGGLFALLHIRVNFLNFIALPITFGIGVDYAVNIVQRYTLEGPGGAVTAVRETGGAVILCSMTTTLGYLALVSSMNLAVRSLGLAAVLGEMSCLLAAVLVLPAVLLLWDRWHHAKVEAVKAEAGARR
jgi:predicted RND superfamily exporter protein